MTALNLRRRLLRLLGGAPFKVEAQRTPPRPFPASTELDNASLDRFERAFCSRSSGSVRRCHCGRRFYNPDGGWDWEDGELEELRADKTATNLEWSVGSLLLEGREYVLDCDCWHRRAAQVVTFLRWHDEFIAEFLKLEKQAALADAARKPEVA